MDVRRTDFTEPEVVALVEFHRRKMYETSPADGVFALDLGALRIADITGFAAWESNELMGIGALRTDTDYGEIKSMRTAAKAAGKGVGSLILTAIEECARGNTLQWLKLETGPPPHFTAANRFYEKHGFAQCGPFGDYRENQHSVFYAKRL